MSLIAVYLCAFNGLLSYTEVKLTCMGILRCKHRCECTMTCGIVWNGKGIMDVDVVAVDAKMSRRCEDGMGHYFICPGQGPDQHGRKPAV
jgi:hypothetical protein